MHTLSFLAGLILLASTLLDGFETILLPRRIARRLRYSRIYYRSGWSVWKRVAISLPEGRVRETMLSVFGPLSVLGLFGAWILSLIVGFALVHWGIRSAVAIGGHAAAAADFSTYLYLSGTNYFTLGLGDVTPLGRLPRVLTVVEAGLGFAFLAVIVSYLPVLYQAFSRREVTISLMDARAGSPPVAGEYLLRLTQGQGVDAGATLGEWERWCAELLESHISFPSLAYYRSQHANQSWLASLAAVLDTCAIMLALLPPADPYRLQLTFAIARHALVDIALIFGISPGAAWPQRLSPDAMARLHARLRDSGRPGDDSAEAAAHLDELRGMYEPILAALAQYFVLKLPDLLTSDRSADNWQRSPWMPRTPGIGSLPAGKATGSHFD